MKQLDKKWKELLFAFSGFGPNFLMVLMGAYFTDAINPVALVGNTYQAILKGTCFIMPAVFPILYAIAKIFDGIIDIPFAHITDTLSTKYGRRRPLIAICLIPMIVSFAMCWFPVGGVENQLLNTVWIFFWALLFFATYTMCLISFYGSLSTTCCNESQRLRVSSFKSFFDTISYCLVYALVPLILDGFNVHVDKFVFICLPLMLSMVIPLFLIKEGEKYGYPENKGLTPEKIKMIDSVKLTFGNKVFRSWLLVNCCTFFGLQMFLVAMNSMIIGGMNFNGAEMALINTCAFAPVPVMLYLFAKLKNKKGVRFTYQTCLLAFAVAIMSFFFASTFVTGGNKILQYVIACLGGVMGSWAIGAFFMMPYLAPAQISSVEEKLTGKNHSAMYFAGNAVVTSIVGALSSSVLYENIKMLFINKNNGSIIWASSIEEARLSLGEAVQVFNFGTLIVPFIVCFVCIIGFILAFKMPKDYSAKHVAMEFKKQNPSLDISAFVEEESLNDEKVNQEKAEILFVQIGLSILSGCIFGFIWVAFLFKSIKEFLGKKCLVPYLLSCFVPFLSIYFTLKRSKQLCDYGKTLNVQLGRRKVLHIIFGVIFPLLPINLVSLVLLQNGVNKIYKMQLKGKTVNE